MRKRAVAATTNHVGRKLPPQNCIRSDLFTRTPTPASSRSALGPPGFLPVSLEEDIHKHTATPYFSSRAQIEVSVAHPAFSSPSVLSAVLHAKFKGSHGQQQTPKGSAADVSVKACSSYLSPGSKACSCGLCPDFIKALYICSYVLL